MHTYLYMCMYTCSHVCPYTRLYTYPYTCLYACLYVFLHTKGEAAGDTAKECADLNRAWRNYTRYLGKRLYISQYLIWWSAFNACWKVHA